MSGQRFDWPQQQRVHTLLSDCAEDNEILGHGAKEIFAVDATNGVGKSTMVREWAMARYKETVGAAIKSREIPTWQPSPGIYAYHVPVVWVNLSSAASIKEFNTSILKYLDYPVEGTIRSMNLRVSDAIDNHGIRLLVIDDAHLLNTRPTQGRDVLDHIKHINTELGERDGTMVLVGAGLADHPLLKDPQIRCRLRYHRVTPMAIDTVAERSEWQDFLFRVEKRFLPYLPRSKPGLLAGQHAPHIWRRTQGFVGDAVELVRLAARRGVEDESWTITRTHLEDVELKVRAETHARAAARSREQSGKRPSPARESYSR